MMKFSFLEYSIWIAIALGETVLLAIVVGRRLWLRFPLFSLYSVFTVLREIIGTVALRSSPRMFFYVFYFLSIFGNLIMLAVIGELAVRIFRPVASDCRAALKSMAVFAGAAGTIILIWFLDLPPVIAARLPGWAMRTDLLLTCLRFLAFATVAVSSRVIGLHWRHHIFGIATGLGIYSCVDLVSTTLYSQTIVISPFLIHQISKLAYLLSVTAWCFILYSPEPSLAPSTPELKKYLAHIRTMLQSYQRIIGVREP